MSGPRNLSIEESWQLMVDDLFAPLPDTKIRLGGPGPFVINLCTSPLPITPPDKSFAEGQTAHVFSAQRKEDGRPRYRLRLGPFADEDEADAVLLKVRDLYPSALTVRADADDLRVIAKLDASKAAAAAMAAMKVAPNAAPNAAPPEMALVAATAVASTALAPTAFAPTALAPTAFAPTAAGPRVVAAAAATPESVAVSTMRVTNPDATPSGVAVQKPVGATATTPDSVPTLTPTAVPTPTPSALSLRRPDTARPSTSAYVGVYPTIEAAPRPTSAYVGVYPTIEAAQDPRTTLLPTSIPTPKPAAATPPAKPAAGAPPAKPASVPTPKPAAAPLPGTVAAEPPAKLVSVPTPKPAAMPTPKPPAVPTAKHAVVLGRKTAASAPQATPASLPTARSPSAPARNTAAAPPAKAAVPPERNTAAAPPAKAAVAPERKIAAAPPVKPAVAPERKIAAPTAKPPSVPPAKPAAEVKAAAQPLPAAKAPAGSPVKRQGDISKTQTLRTLTILELEEEAASGWFAVQLAQADEAFVPEEVGTHAIFNAYRLYSVAEIQQGNIVHALRLGFFTDELSAQAVASYLSTFYDKPEIKRISVAEHRRFAQQSMAPRQPATREPGGATASAATEAKKERIPAAARNAQSTNR